MSNCIMCSYSTHKIYELHGNAHKICDLLDEPILLNQVACPFYKEK